MTDPKQEIFDILYQFKGDESVLDVGCGDDYKRARGLVREYFALDLKDGLDWYEWPPIDVDVIIANDLFPNVDQRLELFLQKYLPHCKEMRLSLTYFDKPKWYQARRVDGDEVLTMLQWDGFRLWDLLSSNRYGGYLITWKKYPGEFPNGRKVLLVWLEGGLA